MATLTSKKPKPAPKKKIKHSFTAGDIGAWFNDYEEDGSNLGWQVQSRRNQDERGFDLILNNPNPKGNNHIDNDRFVGWFELRKEAQEKAAELSNKGLTWDKAKTRYGPYNREKNDAIKSKPLR